MNCLVLGAAGFIGRHLCKALTASGHQVRGFDLTPTSGEWPIAKNVSWQAGDFANLSNITAALEGVDLVFHLVSSSIPKTSNEAPALDLQKNVGATLGLLDVIAGLPRKPKVIFPSSGGTVYGIAHTIPIPESHPTDPLCAYGIGKLAIEKYLAIYSNLHGIDYCILRIANPYGPYQSFHGGQGAISAFLWKALHGEAFEIWGDGTVIRDYLHISDAVRAIVAAAKYSGQERIFNIGSGVGHSLNELVDLIKEMVGRDIPCRHLHARPYDVPINILSINRAKTELCWQPIIPMQEGMSRLLLYFKQIIKPAIKYAK